VLKKEKGVAIIITIDTGIDSGFFYDGMLIPNLEVGKMLHTDGQIIEMHIADSIRKKNYPWNNGQKDLILCWHI
jgi:polyphosphate glucokinase